MCSLLLKKHLTDDDNKTEIYFYCSECANYLGVDPGTACALCSSRKGLLEKAYYFLVMPLENQLRNVVTRVQQHLTKEAPISEVDTVAEYNRRDGRITLTFQCDSSSLPGSSELSV